MKDCLIIGPTYALHYDCVYGMLVDGTMRLGHRGDLKINGRQVFERLIIRRKR